MRRILLLGLISFALIITGLYTVNGQLLALAIPFVLYLLSGLQTTPTAINLRFERTLSAERVGPNTPVEITLKVTNTGSSLHNVLIQDELSANLTITDGSPHHLLTLSRGEHVSWSYTLQGKRGYYPFSSIQVDVQDRFGLFHKRLTFPTEGQLLILPPVLKLKRVTIRPRRTRVYSGEIPARSGGLGVEFFGVREFQPGDSPGWINWRASARHHNTLFSNEFEQERVADVGIILDGRPRSNFITQDHSLFEHSVVAAATLANAFLARGNRVGLLHYGEYPKWTFPGYGKLQRERIMQALSQVEPGYSQVFSYLQYIPTQLFPPHSQIVLISPLTPDDPDVLVQIRARGYRVMVISPDPVAFERAYLPDQQTYQQAARVLRLERELLLQKVVRGGIRLINWDVAQPFDQVAQRLSRSPVVVRSAELGQ